MRIMLWVSPAFLVTLAMSEDCKQPVSPMAPYSDSCSSHSMESLDNGLVRDIGGKRSDVASFLQVGQVRALVGDVEKEIAQNDVAFNDLLQDPPTTGTIGAMLPAFGNNYDACIETAADLRAHASHGIHPEATQVEMNSGDADVSHQQQKNSSLELDQTAAGNARNITLAQQLVKRCKCSDTDQHVSGNGVSCCCCNGEREGCCDVVEHGVQDAAGVKFARPNATDFANAPPAVHGSIGNATFVAHTDHVAVVATTPEQDFEDQHPLPAGVDTRSRPMGDDVADFMILAPILACAFLAGRRSATMRN